MLDARRVRAAALFCSPVKEPEREAGPAAMAHGPPPVGKRAWALCRILVVHVDVDAGGALKRREPQLKLPWNLRLEVLS